MAQAIPGTKKTSILPTFPKAACQERKLPADGHLVVRPGDVAVRSTAIEYLLVLEDTIGFIRPWTMILLPSKAISGANLLTVPALKRIESQESTGTRLIMHEMSPQQV